MDGATVARGLGLIDETMNGAICQELAELVERESTEGSRPVTSAPVRANATDH
jgi:hypothetical protein